VRREIADALDRLPAGWLSRATHAMVADTRRDWREWRAANGAGRS
jgi:hypothetical protein